MTETLLRVAGLASVWLSVTVMPFFAVRQNRTATGRGVLLSSVLPGPASLVIILYGLALVLVVVTLLSDRVSHRPERKSFFRRLVQNSGSFEQATRKSAIWRSVCNANAGNRKANFKSNRLLKLALRSVRRIKPVADRLSGVAVRVLAMLSGPAALVLLAAGSTALVADRFDQVVSGAVGSIIVANNSAARVTFGAGFWVMLGGAWLLGQTGGGPGPHDTDRKIGLTGKTGKTGEADQAVKTVARGTPVKDKATMTTANCASDGCGVISARTPGLMDRNNALARRATILTFAIAVTIAVAGGFDQLSMVREFASRRDQFWHSLFRHLGYGILPSFAAALVAIPLGRLAAMNRRVERPLFAVATTVQTIPTLSLLGLLVLPLSALGAAVPVFREMGISGVGWAPASIALFLYALLPVAAHARAGFAQLPSAVLEAAAGMGMNRRQRLYRIELPLAAPALLAGLRTAIAQNMGNAVLAGLIGGGGLGSIVFLGLAQAAPDLVLLGALPAVALSFMVDSLFGVADLKARR